MFDNLKKISDLKAEVKTLNEALTLARESRDEAEISLSRQKTDYQVDLEDERNSRIIEVNRLENENEALEKSIPLKVAKEVAQEKKDLKLRGEKQDREHTDRMKNLETEHAAKIAKSDRDLETDKASYRKYLKTDFNTRIETFEKDNKRLVTENVTLNAENNEQENTIGRLESQVEAGNEAVLELTKGITSLSSKIAEGLVKSVPTITADFETPKTLENHVHVEVPGAAKGGQGGGNKDGGQKN